MFYRIHSKDTVSFALAVSHQMEQHIPYVGGLTQKSVGHLEISKPTQGANQMKIHCFWLFVVCGELLFYFLMIYDIYIYIVCVVFRG